MKDALPVYFMPFQRNGCAMRVPKPASGTNNAIAITDASSPNPASRLCNKLRKLVKKVTAHDVRRTHPRSLAMTQESSET